MVWLVNAVLLGKNCTALTIAAAQTVKHDLKQLVQVIWDKIGFYLVDIGVFCPEC